MTPADFEQWLVQDQPRPLVMGILNVTPDSFSDGGRYADPSIAADHVCRMCERGADIIDIGGESTRPGSQRVSAAEQLRRILPVFDAIRGELPTVLSVDTTLAEVARAALDCGAQVVNDVSSGREDPGMLPLVAACGASVVLMHMQGQPATMQVDPHYECVVEEVKSFLASRLAAAEAAGIPRHRILLDPGIGFGKTLEHNLALLQRLGDLRALGRPLVVGTSRKGFIGRITGEADAGGRLMGTAASVAWSIANGAAIVRVHDVEPLARLVKMVHAIQLGRIP